MIKHLFRQFSTAIGIVILITACDTDKIIIPGRKIFLFPYPSVRLISFLPPEPSPAAQTTAIKRLSTKTTVSELSSSAKPEISWPITFLIDMTVPPGLSTAYWEKTKAKALIIMTIR